MPVFDNNANQLQQYAQAFANGNYIDMPQDQVAVNYQSFLKDTPDDQVEQIHQDYFNQMPQTERVGLFNGIVHALGGQNNFNPRQAGVSTTDANKASALDLGNLFRFAANSGLLQGLMGGNQRNGSPGGLLGGLLGGGNQQQQSGGGLLGGLLGGSNQQQQSGGGLLDNLIGGGNRQQPQPQNPNDYAQTAGNSSGDLHDGLRRILSNPMAQAAVSGLVGYVANRAVNGGFNFGQRNNQQNQANAPFDQSDQPTFEQGSQANWGQGEIQTQPGGGSSLPGFDNRNTQL